MSRKKKSRKPGTGSSGIVKDENKTKKIVTPTAKRPKKHTGKQAGNRQQEATKQPNNNQDVSDNRDPRLGSKTPIRLDQVVTKVVNKAKRVKPAPMAAVRVVEADETLEQELHAIEQDERLQLILAKQDEDSALTEQEVDYFNEKMTRHQQIREQLGWHDEDEDEPQPEQKKARLSEDDLWDKFDNNSLSDFE
jgi:ribosome assembly protein YihI (activator of Der GTPase)